MVTGAILAGGRSRRYGRNKALEVFDGLRLIDRGTASLEPYCAPVFVVANDLWEYADVQAVLLRDLIAHQGPLGGIATALWFSPHEWVFVKAADMPFLVPELLTLMLGAKEGFDAVVPVHRELYEPLLALYHRRCLPAVNRVLEGPERKVIAFYRQVKVRFLQEFEWKTVDPKALSFMNANTPEEMAALEWNWKKHGS
ncbi:MAG TPA: molybdenum cofactor guanylyltransferase [Syntrophobacteraceae bacterium]|nr:molybdenum cofactor guanylyltransferase [Syntrophobacteraceae bacterium]